MTGACAGGVAGNGCAFTPLPVPGPFDGGVAGAAGAVVRGAVVAGAFVAGAFVTGAPPVAGPVDVAGPLPVPGPFGPAVPVPAFGAVPTGAAPEITPDTTGVGFAFVLLPDGSSVDGIVSTVGAGLATAVGVPWIGRETSVTPGERGGGRVGSLGPGAVDSPITGPTVRGCAGCAHAAAPTSKPTRSCKRDMAGDGASLVPSRSLPGSGTRVPCRAVTPAVLRRSPGAWYAHRKQIAACPRAPSTPPRSPLASSRSR